MTQLARRMGIFGVALVLALTLGTASVGAQDLSTVGRIVSTNSPEYRQITGQARAQNTFDCGFYGGNCFYGGVPFGYYGGQQFGYYGGQQFAYNGGVPFYGGQQFAYGGLPYYGGGPVYAPGFNTFGYAVPDQFFRAVGCEVGNYSCYYNQVGFPR